MYDVANAIILDYEKEHLSAELSPFDRNFRKNSYSKWAAEELRMRIMNESLKLPESISRNIRQEPKEIIIEFIEEMEYYSGLNIKTRYLFKTAEELGIQIFYLFA